MGADLAGEADLEVDAVSADSVLVRMNYAGARMNLVVLDACRNNPYRGRFRSPKRGLAEMSAPRGSLVAYSTAPGDVAEDGTGKNSPYSTALAEAMGVADLPVELAFKRVRYAVMQATGNRQVPWESSSLVGDFYFAQTVLVPPPAQQPAAKPPPVVATIPPQAAIPKTGAAMDSQQVWGLLERAKNGDASAVDELRRNADAGDPVAQTGLAIVYLAGHGGVAKDDAEAARLTRLAAVQGFPPAEYDLALLYFTGRGIPKDVEQSAKWLEKAANRGIVEAQNKLGLLYAIGQGVPKNLRKSAALFRKAADQGFAEAQNNLGVLYANGEGVKKDPEEAKKLFDKAAAQGHPGAQRNIELLQKQQ